MDDEGVLMSGSILKTQEKFNGSMWRYEFVSQR